MGGSATGSSYDLERLSNAITYRRDMDLCLHNLLQDWHSLFLICFSIPDLVWEGSNRGRLRSLDSMDPVRVIFSTATLGSRMGFVIHIWIESGNRETQVQLHPQESLRQSHVHQRTGIGCREKPQCRCLLDEEELPGCQIDELGDSDQDALRSPREAMR